MTQWVDVKEAAEYLGVAVETVKRRARKGELPARREQVAYGFRWQIDLAALPEQPQTEATSNGHGEVEALKLLVAELQKDKVQLWEEVEARRREVSELHILLQRSQEQARIPQESSPRDPTVMTGDITAVVTPSRRVWWRFWAGAQNADASP